jgi:hypothetical protein
VKGLVLLVDFSDQVASIPQGDVVNFCNQVGYTPMATTARARLFQRLSRRDC